MEENRADDFLESTLEIVEGRRDEADAEVSEQVWDVGRLELVRGEDRGGREEKRQKLLRALLLPTE